MQASSLATITTRSFSIVGRVTRPAVITFEELCAMDRQETQPLPLICGSGEPKGQLGVCCGVLLSDVINRADIVVREHNDTKKMLVVAEAADGYRAVFSWQEIFNSANGEGILIVLELNGQPLYAGSGEVDLISSHDFLTGPRYVHRLAAVEIVLFGA